jgi:TolB-like protein/DNA-binding winged helix-turn-helix (wHTH) protein/Flp pilus assembly protein TadD
MAQPTDRLRTQGKMVRLADLVNGNMSDIFRFEDFELNRNAYELRCAGEVVRLERIPLDLLFLLTARCGALVTRQEILDQIWGKHVVVDADNSINTAVRKIRQALKENPDHPRYLFTVPGKGYRFALPQGGAAVVASDTQVEAAAIEGAPVLTKPRAGTGSPGTRARTRWWAIGAALILILATAASIVAVRHSQLATRAGPIMLVVLPFVNLSGDPQQEYFVDGMTEELIAQLGGLNPAQLAVIARTTAMQYKGSSKDVGQIAHELGVDFVLEGSIRKVGSRVRITGQLIQASAQTHLWAGSYDGDVSDILKLQSAVASGIAAKIRLTLSPEVQNRVSSAPLLNASAHEAYLLGLQALNLRTNEGSSRSIAEFSRAIAIDPNYAPAYAALAGAYSLSPLFRGGRPLETMPRALDAALRALQLDDSLADAHTTLAFVRAHYQFDWAAAEREFLRALELNPSDAQTHFFYSNSYLSPFARHVEAIAEMRTAVELDPLSVAIQAFVGRSYLWARRYGEALAELQKAQQMNPNSALIEERLAHLYTYTGAYDKAIEAETRARVFSGETAENASSVGAGLRKALAEGGPRGYWQAVLRLSQSGNNPPESYSTSYGRAIVFARLGEHEKAIAELLTAYDERDLAMTEIAVEPAFDALRGDPEFSALVNRVGLLR